MLVLHYIFELTFAIESTLTKKANHLYLAVFAVLDELN